MAHLAAKAGHADAAQTLQILLAGREMDPVSGTTTVGRFFSSDRRPYAVTGGVRTGGRRCTRCADRASISLTPFQAHADLQVQELPLRQHQAGGPQHTNSEKHRRYEE